MEKFTKENFEPHVGTKFEVQAAGMTPVVVQLVEVQQSASGATKGFSLLFRGEEGRLIRHDTQTVRHPVLGEMELFLGPVSTGRTDAVYYQAVFTDPPEM